MTDQNTTTPEVLSTHENNTDLHAILAGGHAVCIGDHAYLQQSNGDLKLIAHVRDISAVEGKIYVATDETDRLALTHHRIGKQRALDAQTNAAAVNAEEG